MISLITVSALSPTSPKIATVANKAYANNREFVHWIQVKELTIYHYQNWNEREKKQQRLWKEAKWICSKYQTSEPVLSVIWSSQPAVVQQNAAELLHRLHWSNKLRLKHEAEVLGWQLIAIPRERDNFDCLRSAEFETQRWLQIMVCAEHAYEPTRVSSSIATGHWVLMISLEAIWVEQRYSEYLKHFVSMDWMFPAVTDKAIRI